MKKNSLLVVILILVAGISLPIPDAQGQSGAISTIVYENFDDGSIDNGPVWTTNNDEWQIIDGKLHIDGVHDGSGRYITQVRNYQGIVTTDYLELSFTGYLKSVGKYQKGKQATLGIWSSSNGAGYALNIENEQVNGFPYDHTAITLLYATGTLTSLVTTSFSPQHDTPYTVRAVRNNGVWTLYVNNILIGQANDPGGLNSFSQTHIGQVGSAWYDDVVVKVSEPIQSIGIDIKPGSDPNCINNNGHGVIPVAILGSSSFDTSQIDANTVQLEGLAVRAVGKKGNLQASFEDVNSDGFVDIVVQIEDEDAVFTEGQDQAILTGQTYDGTSFSGTDSICIVP